MAQSACGTAPEPVSGVRRDCYAAVDIGASSGRVVVGFIQDGRICLEEVHRFDNRQVRLHGHDCWDIDLLFGELVHGLARCKERGFAPKSVGIDTWGVDFVLLDAEDNLVGNPVAYRDERTQGMFEVADAIMAPEELYQRTGIQRQPFNTLYQFLALQRQNPEQLEAAESFLMIPDYLGFLLTGEKAIEYTNASTTGMLNAETGAWDETVLAAFDIPRRLFRNVTMAGACLGPVKPDIAQAIGYETSVVLPATHDTGSAYLAVPACDLPAVFLSSGTWSLLGVENRSPLTTASAYAENFTNEGGYHFRYRFLKNIMGLWMIQSIRRELNGVKYVVDEKAIRKGRLHQYTGIEGLGREVGFEDLIKAADEAEEKGLTASIVNVNDDRFLSPDSMIEEICAVCEETGQTVPKTLGELMICVYESLALCYRDAVEGLSALAGHPYQSINIVGGGCRDDHLNRRTAQLCGLPVYAGPVEGTALGNLAVQMLADGVFPNLRAVRAAIAESFDVRKFEP